MDTADVFCRSCWGGRLMEALSIAGMGALGLPERDERG